MGKYKVTFNWEFIYKNVLIIACVSMLIFIKDILGFRQYAVENNL